MQRCPYIHEMKERLLGPAPVPVRGEIVPLGTLGDARACSPHDARDYSESLEDHVGTIVKLNSDGYGSHTSPARAPLVVPEDCEDVLPARRRCSDCDARPRGPKNAKTSLFIIMSFIYAKLLVVVCIAYVIGDVITHNLPLYYYEGFFTYLYGMSILFLLYVFCFLLQESACCNGSPPKPKPPPKEKKQKKEKEKKTKDKDKEGKKDGKSKEKDKDKESAKEKPSKESKKQSQFSQEVYPRKMRDIVREQQLRQQLLFASEQDIVEVESGVAPGGGVRRRKTTQNDHSHGSFFLRIGAIAFGLGTMIYNGLEFGTFFEVPFDSACYMILRGINPVLQMVFTFMQMYFIFMNSRLNIHRFKVVARFGLMHVMATNLCVWIRTLVLESLKEITAYHLGRPDTSEYGIILESIRRHTLRNSGAVFGSHLLPNRTTPAPQSGGITTTTAKAIGNIVNAMKTATHTTTSTKLPLTTVTTSTTTTLFPPYMYQPKTPQSAIVKRMKSTVAPYQDPWFKPQQEVNDPWANDDPWTTKSVGLTTILTPINKLTTAISTSVHSAGQWALSTIAPFVTSSTTKISPTTTVKPTAEAQDIWNFNLNNIYRVDEPPHSFSVGNASEVFESFDNLNPAALLAPTNSTLVCPRVNIMGTIVQDAAPYLYPFIIEYSLIGAVVIYVMWKHIGRHPSSLGEEELERRLEAVLSRRAAALAHARRGQRVDCQGASKGLFCGLLLLVGALICLILFFVLVRHPRLGLLAVYLADVSHCALMLLSILAIIIGFIRVQSLKFRSEEQSDLNDILLRVSAFGLFIYAVFSVIAGSLGAFTSEPNLLVMITGILSVVQVVLQLLFIADVSRRRVHLPEQERSKPARQAVTFLLICNLTMWLIYTFEAQKVQANPVQLDFYGFLAWSIVQRVTLPLCIFHRFHSAVTLAEIWKTTYKPRLD